MSLVNKHEVAITTCCYCGVGCGIIAKKDNQGRLQIEGDKSHPVNKGMLCSKGMNLHYTVNDTTDRLLYPEMRYGKDQPRQRVSWDIALERTAAVFKTLIKKYGPDSVESPAGDRHQLGRATPQVEGPASARPFLASGRRLISSSPC